MRRLLPNLQSVALTKPPTSCQPQVSGKQLLFEGQRARAHVLGKATQQQPGDRGPQVGGFQVPGLLYRASVPGFSCSSASYQLDYLSSWTSQTSVVPYKDESQYCAVHRATVGIKSLGTVFVYLLCAGNTVQVKS